MSQLPDVQREKVVTLKLELLLYCYAVILHIITLLYLLHVMKHMHETERETEIETEIEREREIERVLT